eukprot:scaffold7161_cov109-Isochrysis_galbana.AAC.9
MSDGSQHAEIWQPSLSRMLTWLGPTWRMRFSRPRQDTSSVRTRIPPDGRTDGRQERSKFSA